ncbi:hypothetical protein P171DRAFT_202830 [Karstenula rhodostoma CBS 690.94]|uniref:Zn(2)-C6 fungal-type domain-containing protein n=1 Tax=Karstenula rhodostoma CBS 690.94 TaxID=1392251 RepID=A0A9P4PTJ7_9PLEO|nr:hypothetical protein P171DRAFT_202830 [Karstenula rhodostoma CBS 690.94]
MVSRAGRSRGCSNCRQRRVKCDENRPICNRCKKRNLTCDGPKDSTWISFHHDLPPSGHLHNSIPEELSFIAFEDDMCVSYARKHLMRGGCVEVACDLVQRVGLGGDVLDPGLSLLRDAILSLSATFYGNQHRQSAITNRGYKTYGKVLGQLNAHLAQPRLQTTNETIMTAVICMILEISVPTDPNNFFKHVQGIEAIIAARGPPTSPHGTDPSMLSGVRILCIVGAIFQRRPSIWAEEEWKSVPSLHTDEGSLIRHEILLVLADCTVLRKGPDPAPSNKPTDEKYSQPIALAREYLNRLHALYSRWEQHNASMLGAEVSPGFQDPTIANHASATTYLLYNGAYICLLRILTVFSHSTETLSLQSLQVAAALRIVKCLEFQAYKKREGSGESNTIEFVATKVAWDTLGGSDSLGGRRLSRAAKAATNEVYAVGTWDELAELPEPTSSPYATGNVEGVTPLVHEQSVMAASNYKVVELLNVGEKNTAMDTVPLDLPRESHVAMGTPMSPSQIFVA